MRIALIRQKYRSDGGAERFIARALALMADGGAQVTLLTRQWPNADDRTTVIPCDPFFLGAIWRDAGFGWCVRRRLRSLHVDLVQSHERIACGDIFRAGDGLHREWLAQRFRALGWFGRLRVRLNPYHYYVKAAERAVFLNPGLRAVVCGSTMVRDEIKRHFGVGEQRLAVIYNGVDCDKFHPAGPHQRAALRQQLSIPPQARVFLFIGSGFVRKGLQVALEALAGAPSECVLLVVGRDKRARHFKGLATALGIAQRVWFVGPQVDPLPFYGAADALVLPALYDPSPNVIFEALASGLPVIASTKSGTSELLQEGHTGYVRDALDVPGIRHAMGLLVEPARLAAMGVNARRLAEAYSASRAAQQLLDLYRRLMQERVSTNVPAGP